MKNLTTTARNQFFNMVVAGIIAAGTFNSAGAQNNSATAQDSSTTPLAPQIKYVGTMGDKLVFQIDYDNRAQEGFSVEIKDQEGFQFYFDEFRDKTFKKKFAIERSELGTNAITFTVATKSGVRQRVFDVNASFRVVEEVSVVKL